MQQSQSALKKLCTEDQFALVNSLAIENPEKEMHIDCNNQGSVKIRSYMVSPIRSSRNDVEICVLASSLEFELKSRGDSAEYENIKLSFNVPKELYDIGEKKQGNTVKKSGFDVIVDLFLEVLANFIKKFPDSPDRQAILDDIQDILNRSNSLEGVKVIEVGSEKQSEVSSRGSVDSVSTEHPIGRSSKHPIKRTPG